MLKKLKTCSAMTRAQGKRPLPTTPILSAHKNTIYLYMSPAGLSEPVADRAGNYSQNSVGASRAIARKIEIIYILLEYLYPFVLDPTKNLNNECSKDLIGTTMYS